MACLLMTAGLSAQTSYKPAVYPQQQETAGKATLTKSGTTYTLTNSLFSASFTHEGGKLTFAGSEAMNLKASDDLFIVKFGTGSKVVKSSEMTLKEVTTETLTGSPTAVKGSHHFDGVQLKATYEYTYAGSKVTIDWYAELRDGSHYLKTDMTLSADKDVKMFAVIPMQYTYDAAKAGSTPKKVGNTWGSVFMNDKVFFGLETPMGKNSVESGEASDDAETEGFVATTWAAADFKWTPSSLPAGITNLPQGYNTSNVIGKQGYVSFAANGTQTMTLQWTGGNLRLDLAGIDIMDPETMEVVAQDYHHGFCGSQKQDHVYTINVPAANKVYMLRYFVDCKSDGDKIKTGSSTGNFNWSTTVKKETYGSSAPQADVVLQGLWDRNATLLAVEPWNVSGIIGLVDPAQKRRTVLAYSERERAVPWRPFPHYNSWWELNIDRNNHTNPVDNLKESQVLDVVSQWKTNLFDKYGVGIEAFVIDDGWDQYGIWEPHAGFPNGFTNFDELAAQMCTGIGMWLGPCGGYGGSGSMRNKYWTDKGGQHRLSYAPFYDTFKGAINKLVQNYDTRYFKFDGISQQYPHPIGPDENTAGIENCEGIIRAERYVRENVKEDIFFNTTVGTWASPFWFHFTDAVWRGQDDWNKAGNNPNDREAWITYRDKLVYDWFVKESPMCPINSMMTHGVIISTHGSNRSSNRDYQNARNEMRCAFACGSGMVELYCDYELLNSINNGALWKDMAECLKWQRENADVLPDAHWVGGSPWDGSKHNIYGWASWNGVKATLALRNGDTASKKYTFTLREALEIPEGVNGSITLTDAFKQSGITGITSGKAYGFDESITVTLPASSVYVYNGVQDGVQLVKVESIHFEQTEVKVGAGSSVAPTYYVAPLDASNKTLSWSSDNEEVASVKDGAVIAHKEGTAVITATANDGSGVEASVTVTVEHSMQNDLKDLITTVQETYDANEVNEYGPNLITQTSQFSSNASETTPNEGSLNDLLDLNGSTFWHSLWSAGEVGPHTHYLQVKLSEPIEGYVQLTMMRRIKNGGLCGDDNPVRMTVEASTDNIKYTLLDGEMNFDNSSTTVYGYFQVPTSAKYLRFFSEETNGKQRGYWHCGDFQLNLVTKEAVNSQNAEAAAALAAALREARSVRGASREDVDALQDAYEAYLKAISSTTGLVGARYSTSAAKVAYDLAGRRVNASVNAKGIFIVGGKKVIR
ncbi:MAG: Ig-like domain-containing protein [Bacteroidales bacterium]|nr:Ig-like domain-containing protein [Candidatus Physcousia equi]